MKSLSTLNDIVSILSDYAEVIGLIATLPTLKNTAQMILKSKQGKTMSNSDLQQILDAINDAKDQIILALKHQDIQIKSIQSQLASQNKKQDSLALIKSHIHSFMASKDIHPTETSSYTVYKVNGQNFLEIHHASTKLNGTDYNYIKLFETPTIGDIVTIPHKKDSNRKEVYGIPINPLTKSSLTYIITMIENSLHTHWNR